MAKEILGKELDRLLSKPTISVEQAGQIMGLSRDPAYEAVQSKQIPSIRLGRSIKVPTAGIRKMLGLDSDAA